MLSLVDTNILVYACDARFPEKREIANRLILRGLAKGSLRVSHQSIVEFVSAVTRPRKNLPPILPWLETQREVQEMLEAFDILYPTEATLRTALMAAPAFQLSWYDAHLWAYAETNDIPEILSEDFNRQRIGRVRIVNPFS